MVPVHMRKHHAADILRRVAKFLQLIDNGHALRLVRAGVMVGVGALRPRHAGIHQQGRIPALHQKGEAGHGNAFVRHVRKRAQRGMMV